MVAVIALMFVYRRKRRRIKKEEKRMLGYYVAPATQENDNSTSCLFFSMLEHLVSDGLHLMFLFRITCFHTVILYHDIATDGVQCFGHWIDTRSGPQHDIILHMSPSGKLLDVGRYSYMHERSNIL